MASSCEDWNPFTWSTECPGLSLFCFCDLIFGNPLSPVFVNPSHTGIFLFPGMWKSLLSEDLCHAPPFFLEPSCPSYYLILSPPSCTTQLSLLLLPDDSISSAPSMLLTAMTVLFCHSLEDAVLLYCSVNSMGTGSIESAAPWSGDGL